MYRNSQSSFSHCENRTLDSHFQHTIAMHESRLQRLSYFIFVLIGVVFITITARSLLIPFVFAGFFALMLLPVASRIQRLVHSRIAAILITMLASILLILGVVSFFSLQMVEVMNNMQAIGTTIQRGIENLAAIIAELGFLKNFNLEIWVQEHIGTLLEQSGKWAQKAVVGSTAALAAILLTIVYVFFMLLYAHPFKRLLVIQARPENRDAYKEMLQRVQRISLKYLVGMLTVVLILGVLNSIGLWAIGVNYAIFWGFLAGFLAVIPYIGTFLGGLLPFLYAIPTSDTWTTPLLVIALFVVVQFIEGNLITPKIVGNSVSLNPFMAIIALVIGNAIWGIPGMILAIPLTAVIKTFFSVLDPFKPIAVLMADNPITNSATMEQDFSDLRFSFWRWITHGDDSG